MVPRGQHPTPGGARCDRIGARGRPGRVDAVPRRGRTTRGVRLGGRSIRVGRSRRGCTPRIHSTTPHRAPGWSPDWSCRPTSASTRGSTPGRRSRRSTTRSSASCSCMPRRAGRRSPRSATRWRRRGSVASRRTGTNSPPSPAVTGSPTATMTTTSLDGFLPVSAEIKVLDGGLFTTVQDLPARLGYWDVGIPPSGPMDDRSHRLANALLGNAEERAGVGDHVARADDRVPRGDLDRAGRRRLRSTPRRRAGADVDGHRRRSRQPARTGPLRGARDARRHRGGGRLRRSATSRQCVDVRARRLRRSRRSRTARR